MVLHINKKMIIWSCGLTPSFYQKGWRYSHPGLHVWASTSTGRTPSPERDHTPLGEFSKHWRTNDIKYRLASLQTCDSWPTMQTPKNTPTTTTIPQSHPKIKTSLSHHLFEKPPHQGWNIKHHQITRSNIQTSTLDHLLGDTQQIVIFLPNMWWLTMGWTELGETSN